MKITICGSISFFKEMESMRDQLLELGHEVKMPELALEAPQEFGVSKKMYFANYIEENGGVDAFPVGHEIWDLKEGAIRDHFKKIEWADAILIPNYKKHDVNGYVGGNTLMYIGVAFYLKKKIFVLNSIDSNLSYKQEILGMKPILLKDDLDLIK